MCLLGCRTYLCSFHYDVQYCLQCCAILHANSQKVYEFNIVLKTVIRSVTEEDEGSVLDVCQCQTDSFSAVSYLKAPSVKIYMPLK